MTGCCVLQLKINKLLINLNPEFAADLCVHIRDTILNVCVLRGS